MRISDWSSDVCSSDLVAGQNWSETHLYHGYTSYASLNDLPQRDPRIGDLVRHLNRHVAAFAKDCAFDLGGKRPKLDSLWINVLEPGGTHSGHIHPHSVVSGRSEEHTSELKSLMRLSYAVFCLKKKNIDHSHIVSNILIYPYTHATS